MGELLLVIGLVLLTAFIFVVWLIVRVATWIVGGLFGFARGPQPQQATPAVAANAPRGWMSCRHPGCRETNPLHARFCRRCGNQMAGTGAVARLRYVA